MKTNIGDYYTIYDNGIIINNHTGMEVAQQTDMYGYVKVYIRDGGKYKLKYLHRLVAESFIPLNNMSKLAVHHIDNNKQNNSVANLEWDTRSNIEKKCHKDGIYKNNIELKKKRIRLISDIELPHDFNSLLEAAHWLKSFYKDKDIFAMRSNLSIALSTGGKAYGYRVEEIL